MIGFILTWCVFMLVGVPLAAVLTVTDGPRQAWEFLRWLHGAALVAHPHADQGGTTK